MKRILSVDWLSEQDGPTCQYGIAPFDPSHENIELILSWLFLDNVSDGDAKSGRRQSKKKKTKTTRVNLLWYKDSWLSFPALEINK